MQSGDLPDKAVRWVEVAMDKSKAGPSHVKPSSENGDQLERTLNELREANERLILAGVRMQELAEDAQTSRSTAEQANKAKDEFLATLSHELRTPLNAILGWIHLLRHGSISAAQVEHAYEVIERNAKLQAQLISDLLSVAQIISGKLRLDRELTALKPIVEASVESLRPASNEKSIVIECTTEPGIQRVLIDPARIQQVIWNVLSNAIKFTPRGGLIRLHLRQTAATAVLSVSDSGAGIESASLPRIFEQFFQADSRTDRVFGGLGLGLAIAKRLMELHGGTISAESAGKGSGATFTLTFPIRVLTENSAPAAAERKPDRAVLKAWHILLVEDEPDARELMVTILTKSGASVTAVTSVREALAQWNSSAWDLLIADIGLPGQSGYELIRQIRSREETDGHHIPAVALTAYAQSKDRDEALHAGFNVHVTKPFEPETLLREVASLVSRTTRG
jgi:signal transduction histidine kinase/ActR/RegA family two-component response regulator